MAFMSVDNLKNNLTNPARVYMWEVRIAQPIGGTDWESLSLRAQSTTLPGRNVGKINVPYKGSAGVEYPGKLAYSHEWTVTFVEGEDRAIFNAFYNWSQLIMHDNTNISLGGDMGIKTNVELAMLSTNGAENQVIRLVGCFVGAVGEPTLQYEDQVIQYPITFRYDRWEDAGSTYAFGNGGVTGSVNAAIQTVIGNLGVGIHVGGGGWGVNIGGGL